MVTRNLKYISRLDQRIRRRCYLISAIYFDPISAERGRGGDAHLRAWALHIYPRVTGPDSKRAVVVELAARSPSPRLKASNKIKTNAICDPHCSPATGPPQALAFLRPFSFPPTTQAGKQSSHGPSTLAKQCPNDMWQAQP